MPEKTIALKLTRSESLWLQDALEQEISRRVAKPAGSADDPTILPRLRLGSRLAWLRSQTFTPENVPKHDRGDPAPKSQVVLFGFSRKP